MLCSTDEWHSIYRYICGIYSGSLSVDVSLFYENSGDINDDNVIDTANTQWHLDLYHNVMGQT